jgi:hypothetical protein
LNSELANELDPDLAKWSGVLKTNALLADIYDMLAMINANVCALGSGGRAKKPKSYPRPNDNQKKTIGKGALPADQLRAWFDEKRKKRKREVTGND